MTQMAETTILLIEDDAGDVELIRDYLSDSDTCSFDIYHVQRLSEGLTALTERLFDIVLLDLSLPDNLGLDGFHRLQRQAPALPIVILTGNTDQSQALEAVKSGAQDYLLKGYVGTEILVRAIRYAIERQRLWIQLAQQTQQLKAQKRQLEASQHRWHSLVTQHSDAIVVATETGQIQFVNPAAEALFGCAQADLLGSQLSPLTVDQASEIVITQGNGETRIAEMHLTPVEWDNQPALLASLRDITQRKRTEHTLQENQALLRTVITSAPILLFAVNTQEVFTLAEGNHFSVFSTPPETWVGRSLADQETFVPSLVSDIRRALKNEAFTAIRTIGSTTLECWYTPLQNSQGQLEGVVGAATDITTTLALQEERDRLFELSLDLFFIADREGRFRRLNPAFQWKLGYPLEDLTQREFIEFVYPEDQEVTQNSLEKLVAGQPGIFFQNRYQCQDNSYRWMTWSVVFSHAQKAFYGVGHDITDQKKLEERLQYEATHDLLTGLPNRGNFMETLQQQFTLSKRRRSDLFAVLFVDLDRFKDINDTLGHQAGDQLLIKVAQRLNECLRDHDIVARFGGDEFAVLLTSFLTVEDIITAVCRMLNTIAEPMLLDTTPVYTTASIGIALNTGHYQSADAMLRDADTAMYAAKAAGKSRYALYSPSMESPPDTAAKSSVSRETDDH